MAAQTRHVAESSSNMRTFQCQLVVDSATHLPHPRSGDSAVAWSATTYSLSTTATGAHLSRS